MVHIYYGDGKGKTTAAIGLAVRCCGNGQTVLFTQFLKGDYSGERRILECIPNLTLPKLPERVKFVFDMTPDEHAEYKAEMVDLFNTLKESLNSYDMIIADEIFSAVDVGFITTTDIIELINKCPKTTELVLTGHNLDKSVMVYADYVTYMSKVKHPYDVGMSARQGVEY